MIVKICGITSREDAQAAVECGASALGFNFYPSSPRYISPEAARAILEALPGAIWKAGIFVNEPAEKVAELVCALRLDIAQVCGEGALPTGIRVWKAVRVGPQFQPSDLEAWPVVEAFLLDAASEELHGGTGRTFDWGLTRGTSKRIVLAGGLDADNVRQAISQVRPWGVDACSRLETSPGRKDHQKMARFIRAALSENP